MPEGPGCQPSTLQQKTDQGQYLLTLHPWECTTNPAAEDEPASGSHDPPYGGKKCPDSSLLGFCMLRCSSRVWLCATLWIVNCQAPLSMGFSRQEYWSGLPRPPPGQLSDPGMEPKSLMSPTLVRVFFSTNATWEALVFYPAGKGSFIRCFPPLAWTLVKGEAHP